MAAQFQIQIYRDLDPLDRWQHFQKPLDEALQAAGLGEVTGGGTMMDMDTDETIYSDLHVRVTGDFDQALVLIRAFLKRAGAPADTRIIAGDGTDVGLETH
ncbi:MAG: hypothetical protein ABL907_16540 [Hyphomicrobium sp.]